jgi:hypothetical protein
MDDGRRARIQVKQEFRWDNENLPGGEFHTIFIAFSFGA